MKTIVWVLIILGILAIIGGLNNKLKSSEDIFVIGSVVKIALIFLGLILVLSDKQESESHEPIK